MRKFIILVARNRVFANAVLTLIVLGGIMAALSLVREMLPQFSAEKFTVMVRYPGADPEEVEEGVVRKIEEAVRGLEGIKQCVTYSSEHVGVAVIEVKENYDLAQVMRNVRARVDEIPTFPFNADKPIFTEVVLREPVVLLGVSGNMSERLLKEWTEQIRDEIRQIPEISQVEVFGSRNYEIAIEVSEERLREYGLTFNQVAQVVRNSNLNMGGGTIRTHGEEIRIRTIGRKYTDEEFASIIVLARPSGEIITLDRIARINDGFTEDTIGASINGERAVLLGIFKTNREDALRIAEAIKDFVAKKRQQVPQGAKIRILYDNTDMLRSRISLLIWDGLSGLLLVLVVMWLFMNSTLSFWVTAGTAVSYAGAFIALWAFGHSLNMVSLLGMIIMCGVLVDDSIVMGEAVFAHRRKGKPPLQAAVDGICEVGMPVTCAVLTAMVAFLPLAFVGGIMGKLIYVLPVVVISSLLASLVECFVTFPAHLSRLPDPNGSPKGKHAIFHPLKTLHWFFVEGLEWFAERVYAPFIARALHWRYPLLCSFAAILMLTVGLVIGGVVKFEMFPEMDGSLITTNLEYPSGTPTEVTLEAVKRVEEAFLRVAERTKTRSGESLIVERVAVVGQGLGGVQEIGPNHGAVQVVLLDSEKRGVHSKDLIADWEREVGPIPGVRSLKFEAFGSGPASPPIEVWIRGKHMESILAAADDLKSRLRLFDGVYQVHSDFRQGKNEVRLALKPEARGLGLNVSDLARQVQAGYYGEEALRLQRGREDVRVKVRYTNDERSQISDLWNVRIRTQGGQEVPLLSVADVQSSPGISTIVRTNGLRRVTVSAAVDTKRSNATEILAELTQTFFPYLKEKYPELDVSIQGEQRETRDSFGSLLWGFPLALIGIFVIMATTFKSYLQPFVLMFAVPFGIIGAILGHLLMGYNLSLMSVFGMVALAGIVVNDGIVLMERINTNLANGETFFDAVVKAGHRRFRAIFLTSVTTWIGLAPLILETDLQAKFLVPTVLSIAFGGIFSTFLTLLFVPNLLVVLNDFRCLFHRIRYGEWASRETLEPASHRNTDTLFCHTEPEQKSKSIA